MLKLIIIPFLLLFSKALLSQDLNAIKNNGQSDEQKADSIFKYARKNFQRAKFDLATIWLTEGLPFALQSKNDTLISQYYIEMGNAYLMQGAPAKALNFLWNAKTSLDKKFSYNNLNSCYILLAKCHTKFDDADSALYYFRKAEDLNNSYNKYRNWITYLEMGSFFAGANNFSESEKYFTKSYTITKEKAIRADHGLTLYHLSNFYFKRNMTEKFAIMVNEQQDFVRSGKKDFNKDPVHSFLFIDWGKTGFVDKVTFLQNVKQKLLSNGNFINGALLNEEISKLYEQENRFDEALKYIDESLHLAEQENSSSNIYIYNKIAYRLLKKCGRLKEANERADKLFALKDSLSVKQNLEAAIELDTKYQTEKKEKEIALLNSQKLLSDKEIILLNSQKQIDKNAIELLNADKQLASAKLRHEIEMSNALSRENELMDSAVNTEKAYSQSVGREKEKEIALKRALERENSLQNSQLNKERQVKWGLIGGTSLLLLAGGIILFQYKKQKNKNTVIQKQSEDMQILMKEIHHRVKNNLQVISSLLDLQSMTIADVHASEAVKEGKNRVQSMALIHQNLYSDGNIKGIKTKDYISNLLQSLCDSYNITNDKVKIRTQIDDLNLDVDTMIPLGLVLNEIVSNSLKYAFKNGREGELSILLKEDSPYLLLKVSDNGIGYPEGLNAKEGKSFGMKMIRAFSQKLKAKLDIYNDNGAVVEMQITKYKLA